MYNCWGLGPAIVLRALSRLCSMALGAWGHEMLTYISVGIRLVGGRRPERGFPTRPKMLVPLV